MTETRNIVAISHPGSIADPFWDLLAPLNYGKRQGLTRRLAIGFYEGWHPTRAEVALLVDFELGRITEQEYLAAGPRPETLSSDSSVRRSAATMTTTEGRETAASGRVRPSNGQASRRVSSPTRIATLNVDCGYLAPPFRLLVRGLTSDGWTERGNRRYRLVSLHYILLPPIGVIRGSGPTITPVLYTAAISCVPDITAPTVGTDGRRSQHSVRPGHVAGSRGPWPVADGAHTLEFLFAEQQPVGHRPDSQPAGVLGVDLSLGQATWRMARPDPGAAESRRQHS